MHIFIRTSYFIYRFSFSTLCHSQWERIGWHVVPVSLLFVLILSLYCCVLFSLFFLLSIWRHSMTMEFPFKANDMLRSTQYQSIVRSVDSPINTHNDVQFKLISTLKIEFLNLRFFTRHGHLVSTAHTTLRFTLFETLAYWLFFSFPFKLRF